MTTEAPRKVEWQDTQRLICGFLEQIILGDDTPNVAEDYPNVEAWLQRLNSRQTVKKVKAARDAALVGNPLTQPKSGIS